MRYYFVLLSITVIASFSGCKQKSARTSEEPEKSESVLTIKAADFNADSAFYFVNEQVKFGPRVPNSKAHAKCAVWLETTLKKYTPQVIVQPFTAKAYDGTTLNCKNIIASFNPKSTTRVLLCSHWDSRPYADNDPDSSYHRTPIDGANDGASGVGILLEIARQLKISPASIGVDILLLDAEDYGAPQNAGFMGADDWALGSQYWSRYPHTPSYSARFGILLDMVTLCIMHRILLKKCGALVRLLGTAIISQPKERLLLLTIMSILISCARFQPWILFSTIHLHNQDFTSTGIQ